MLDGVARYLTARPASRSGTDNFGAEVASEPLATGHRRRGHCGPGQAGSLASTVPGRPGTQEF